jgi:predicted dehydrogenase
MKFLIIGCGSIGERHLMNLLSFVHDAQVDVFDIQSDRMADICKRYPVKPLARYNLWSGKYDCTLICTHPSSHIELAIQALKAGSNVFIEKPLSHSSEGIQILRTTLHRKKLLGFVGYNLRFNDGVRILKQMVDDLVYGRVVHASAYFGQYLPDWRPWQNYKRSYTGRKELGGGIIHDGSHEIDYMKWLFGEPMEIQSQFSIPEMLEVNAEGLADILLKFDKGVQGYIHLDFIRRQYRRAFELLTENGLIQWSLSEGQIRIFDATQKSWKTVELEKNLNRMYEQEIEHVINCIAKDERSSIIDIENGISTLKLTEAVYTSGRSGNKTLYKP